MQDKTIKDLEKLRELFPDMDSYTPDESISQQQVDPVDELSPKDKAQMKLYVSRDKKHRAGKQVTIVQGHEGHSKSLESLLAKLKSLCSAGGTLKDGELLIQGDHVKKVMQYLLQDGYKQTKQKGG